MAQKRIEFRQTPLQFDTTTISAGNEVLQATNQLSSTVQKIIKDKNIETGTLEGRQEVADQGMDWRPAANKKNLLGFTWETSRDKAREASAYEAYISRSRIDIRDNNSRLAIEYATDPEGYKSAITDYLSGITQGLPEDLKNQVGLIGEDYASNSYTQLNNAMFKRQEETDLIDIIEGNNVLADQSISLSSQGDYAGVTTQYDDFIISMDNMVANGTMSAETAVSKARALREKIDYQFHEGRISRLVQEGDFEGVYDYMKALTKNNEFAVVSPIGLEDESQAYGNDPKNTNKVSEQVRDNLIALTNGIITKQVTQDHAIDKVKKDDAKEILSGYQKRTNDGGLLDIAELDAFIESVEAIGDEVLSGDVRQFADVYKYLNQDTFDKEGNRNTAFANRSLRDQERYLNALRASTDTAGNKLLITTAEKIFESANNGDILYGVERGWYDRIDLDFSNPDTLDDQIADRKVQAEEFKFRTGKEVLPFTTEEIDLIAKDIDKNPALLAELIQGLGGDAVDVLQEMGVNNPVVGMAGDLWSRDKPEVANSLLLGQQMIKSNPSQFPFSQTEFTSAQNLQFAGVYGNNIVHQRAVMDSVKARYAYLSNNSGEDQLNSDGSAKFDDDLYEQAVMDVSTPIVEVNDRMMVSPNPDWNWEDAEDNTESWIENIQGEDLDGVSPELASYITRVNFKGFTLRPTADGTGYAVVQNYPAGPVLKEDGTLFVLTYSEEVFNRENVRDFRIKNEPVADLSIPESTKPYGIKTNN